MPETERMTLRRTNWPDVDELVALNGDPEVMRHLDRGQLMTAARVLAEEMPRLMAHNNRPDRLGFWVARDRSTDAFLGWFMLRPLDDPPGTVELAFRLARRAWGQGYATEGSLQMIELAREADLKAVVASANASHHRARRVLEKSGLKLVPNSAAGAGEPPDLADERAHYALDLTVPRPASSVPASAQEAVEVPPSH